MAGFFDGLRGAFSAGREAFAPASYEVEGRRVTCPHRGRIEWFGQAPERL